ncbi:MAG: cell division protein FtsW [Runella slithyformis]|nr:MAG: cell division protein FtsW [Runella slithyformis]TAF97964.1 MAG: cell division protein FtsW [Runella sp.]TAG22973.1 MAG: cell division protein FtsW [Cytophagales bacterium]TAG42028.1 MAG: cell division protein FtsW [Cytophagia bacterium]TAE99159.1 MAG: cell division protein FtsW [Runella slithyformis]
MNNNEIFAEAAAPQPSPSHIWENFKEWIRRNLKGDIIIWLIVVLLSLGSMLVVYSATGTLAYQHGGGYPELFLLKHAGYLFVGLFVMWLVHRVNYTYFVRLSRAALFMSIPLLILVKVAGVTINGATRWLAIPGIGITFQPADFARMALIANLAAMLAKRQRVDYDWQVFTRMILWVGIICFCTALSSTSTAALLGITCFLMLFIGRVPAKYLLVMVLFIGVAGGLGLVFGQRLETAKGRIERFLANDEHQARQAIIAVANGGTFGTGPGNSHQRNYLTQAFSDFIYAIIIEEYGLIGGAIVLILYLWLLVRGVKNISLTNRAFGGLLSAGLTLSIVIQAFANMTVAVGLVPVTGQPLPLLSMGGTSILFTCVSLGVVLSVSRGEADESKI